jgi:hypothetical protein
MFMTVITFAVTAVAFFILQYLVDGIWAYYVPVSLAVLSIWLLIIRSVWNAENYATAFTKMEPSAAAGYLSVISVICGVISLILGMWIPLAICVIVFVSSLTMRFPHPF